MARFLKDPRKDLEPLFKDLFNTNMSQYGFQIDPREEIVRALASIEKDKNSTQFVLALYKAMPWDKVKYGCDCLGNIDYSRLNAIAGELSKSCSNSPKALKPKGPYKSITSTINGILASASHAPNCTILLVLHANIQSAPLLEVCILSPEEHSNSIISQDEALIEAETPRVLHGFELVIPSQATAFIKHILHPISHKPTSYVARAPVLCPIYLVLALFLFLGFGLIRRRKYVPTLGLGWISLA